MMMVPSCLLPPSSSITPCRSPYRGRKKTLQSLCLPYGIQYTGLSNVLCLQPQSRNTASITASILVIPYISCHRLLSSHLHCQWQKSNSHTPGILYSVNKEKNGRLQLPTPPSRPYSQLHLFQSQSKQAPTRSAFRYNIYLPRQIAAHWQPHTPDHFPTLFQARVEKKKTTPKAVPQTLPLPLLLFFFLHHCRALSEPARR